METQLTAPPVDATASRWQRIRQHYAYRDREEDAKPDEQKCVVRKRHRIHAQILPV